MGIESGSTGPEEAAFSPHDSTAETDDQRDRPEQGVDDNGLHPANTVKNQLSNTPDVFAVYDGAVGGPSVEAPSTGSVFEVATRRALAERPADSFTTTSGPISPPEAAYLLDLLGQTLPDENIQDGGQE